MPAFESELLQAVPVGGNLKQLAGSTTDRPSTHVLYHTDDIITNLSSKFAVTLLQFFSLIQ